MISRGFDVVEWFRLVRFLFSRNKRERAAAWVDKQIENTRRAGDPDLAAKLTEVRTALEGRGRPDGRPEP
jgi:hypothetical protein